MSRAFLLTLALTAVACAGDDSSMTKEEAAQLSGKADGVGDLCTAYDWYGDGVCDDFCPWPDPDCESTEICFSSDDCAGGEYCTIEDGQCNDTPCAPGQVCPAVCAGVCAPVPEPEPLCYSSDDCADGEHCTTDDGDCRSPCAEGDQDCLAVCAGVCVPDDDEEQVCGGYPGPDGPTRQCDADEYCQLEPGTCNVIADVPGTCKPRPEACIDLWDPVCGCDGQTYSNSCYAAAAGVSVASPDACAPQP